MKKRFRFSKEDSSISPDQHDELRMKEESIMKIDDKVKQLANSINLRDERKIIAFGSEAQERILSFSNSLYEHVQKGDVGEIKNILSQLITKLEEIEPHELNVKKRSFFAKLFRRSSRSIFETLSRFQKAEAQIERISVQLERSKELLARDNEILDQLYEMNKKYYETLNDYIAAGEWKLKELHEKIIPTLRKEWEHSKDLMKKQEVDDFMHIGELLERRLYDLKVSREITIQSAPQIRLIQKTNRALMEKIQSSILTSIPVWKNQMATVLTLVRQQSALKADQHVTVARKKLLMNHDDQTDKYGFKEVDIHTLEKTKDELIGTLQEAITLQQEGIESRREASSELRLLENQMQLQK